MTLETIESLTTPVGLNHVELPAARFGAGIFAGFGETPYTVLSAMGGDYTGQLNIAAGVLRDIGQDRAKALELYNELVPYLVVTNQSSDPKGR